MYDDFARIYDRFQEIEYDKFVEFYEEIFGDGKPKTIIDLGCGSGNITIPLAKRGYKAAGIDISAEMLSLAQNKAFENNLDIMFLNQDMTCFEFSEKVDAVISSLDCINYLAEIKDVMRMFKSVYKALNAGGIFIFDINSEYKLKEILGNNTFVYEDDEAYCVWDCGYFPEDEIVSFDLNFFIKDKSGMYERYSEYQEERIYSIEELKSTAEECGFAEINVFSDLAFEQPREKSERIFFVLRK